MNFWKLHEDRVLEVMHERKMYPPFIKLSIGELKHAEELTVTMSFAGCQQSEKEMNIIIIIPSHGCKLCGRSNDHKP